MRAGSKQPKILKCYVLFRELIWRDAHASRRINKGGPMWLSSKRHDNSFCYVNTPFFANVLDFVHRQGLYDVPKSSPRSLHSAGEEDNLSF